MDFVRLTGIMLDLLGSLGWNVAVYRSRGFDDTLIDAWRENSQERVRVDAESAYLAVIELAAIVAPQMLEE